MMILNDDKMNFSLTGEYPLGGSSSNTPPIGRNFKVNVSFDWFKFNTDRIIYQNIFSDNFSTLLKKNNDDILEEGVSILNNNSCSYKEYELSKEFKEKSYYQAICVNEGISVSFGGAKTKNDRHTTLFNLTGKGCYYFSKNKNYIKCWYQLFDYVIKNQMIATRIDIAYDLIGGNDVDVFIKWLINEIKLGNARTKWHDYYDREILSKNDGYSLYLGSVNSNTNIRIYNKNSEKISKDKNAFIEDENYWRIELTLTKGDSDCVNTFLKKYLLFFKNYYNNDIDKNSSLNEYTNYLMNFLNKNIEIRIKEDGIPIKYCLIVNPIWSNFIGMNKNINFEQSDSKKNSTLSIKKNWCERSVFKALSQVLIAYGESFFCDWLLKNIIGSIDAYSDIDINQINNFFIENGLQNNFDINNYKESLFDKEICIMKKE